MRKNINLIIFLILPAMCALAQQLQVYAQVDDSEPIYVGQRFKLFVVVDGDNLAATVDPAPLEPFDPIGPQAQDISRSMVSIVNGKRTETVTKRYLVSYELIVSKAGDFVIAPLDVTVGAQKYKTQPVKFTVAKPEATNRIDLKAELSKTECFVGEPVVLSVKWYIWQSIASRVSDYVFNVPAFTNNDFIIENTIEVNALTKQSVININGVDTIIRQRAVKHNGNDCVEVSFNKILIAQTTGKIDLDSISLLCRINVSTSRFSFNSQHKSFGTSTEQLQLDVKPLPDDDRPAGFYGLVGDYTIFSQASPVDVKVGDPITLKISVSGDYLKPVKLPELATIEQFAENFIISTDQLNQEIVDNQKVFTLTIRAKKDLIEQIPPIPLHYFDVNKNTYATALSDAIAINVSPTKMLSLSDIEANESVSTGNTLHAAKQGLSANYVGSELLEDMDFKPQYQFVAHPAIWFWLVPFSAFITSLFVKINTKDRDKKKALKLRKTAAKTAISKLKKSAAHDDVAAAKELIHTIRTYFAHRFGCSFAAVTAYDCRNIIQDKTGDYELAETLSKIVEQCEAYEYSPLAVKFDKDWVNEVVGIIERIEKCCK